jgi:hypothetical protein
MTLETDRAVLLRYTRDGKTRRGSGLRIGGQFILTADHCANGTDHRVVVGGHDYAATVHVRTNDSAVDLAVLLAPALDSLTPLRCALVDREVATQVDGCLALGFPLWKDGPPGPRLAQAAGHVPTAENKDPQAEADVIQSMTIKLTGPQIKDWPPIWKGALDQPGSQWAGMSGAVVVTEDDHVIGVVRSHVLAEGLGSLTVTPLAAIQALPVATSARLWAALWVPDPEQLPVVPRSSPAPFAQDRPKMKITTTVFEGGRSAPRVVEIFDTELAELWIRETRV